MPEGPARALALSQNYRFVGKSDVEESHDLARSGSRGGLAAQRDVTARAEWHARQRRMEAAQRKLAKISTDDRTAAAAPAAAAARCLGLSNCHISTAAPLPDETACLGAFAEREEAEQEVP